MCAMQCTILIETCSQCTNSSIFYKNLPSKLAGMQVPQNGRRFGSYLGPQKFPKFLFLFYNIYKLIYNVSHSFLSLFNVKRLVSGKKVRFQPIVRHPILRLTTFYWKSLILPTYLELLISVASELIFDIHMISMFQISILLDK